MCLVQLGHKEIDVLKVKIQRDWDISCLLFYPSTILEISGRTPPCNLCFADGLDLIRGCV